MRIIDKFHIGSKETPSEIRTLVRNRLAKWDLSHEVADRADVAVRTREQTMVDKVVVREVCIDVELSGAELL